MFTEHNITLGVVLRGSLYEAASFRFQMGSRVCNTISQLKVAYSEYRVLQ